MLGTTTSDGSTANSVTSSSCGARRSAPDRRSGRGPGPGRGGPGPRPDRRSGADLRAPHEDDVTEFAVDPSEVVVPSIAGYGGQFNQHVYAKLSSPPVT